jgi:RNA polymerase sigma-70 factor (ECF subfamily)
VERLLTVNDALTEPESEGRGLREDAPSRSASRAERSLDVEVVYRDHADFLWRTLQHLGTSRADLEDAVQEVLVVVHQRGHTYDFECRLTTWLFGICLRVASKYRRRAHLRWEQGEPHLPEVPDRATPEDRLATRQAAARLEALLADLTLEQRATFVMFELEGQSCQEIAELFAVPLGTVYSRLHTARKHVARRLEHERRPMNQGGRS